MDILLINPPRFNDLPVIREERCEITERYSILPPYSLLQIASILRNDNNNVRLIDANGWKLNWEQVENQIRKEKYDVLIFRFTPTTFDWDNKVCSISKENQPSALTVGICWTLRTLPTQVLDCSPMLDVYVRHEYETVVPSLIKAISNHEDLSTVDGIAYRFDDERKVNSDAKSSFDWDSLPLPAYDLLPSLKNYFINTQHGSPFTTLYTSKGCPFSCIFCTVQNTPVKKRSAGNILNELVYLKKNFHVKMVSFFDETFTLDRQRVVALCEAIIKEKLDIKWYCNTRVGLVDLDLLRLMYKAGCRGLSYGIESGSPVILQNAHKGATVEQAQNAIKWAKAAGLKVYCSFIFGLPGENHETIKETMVFVKKTLPTGAQFNVAVPYPGSELYTIAVNKGWIKEGTNWKEMYQHAAVMRTDELSFEDLGNARSNAYRVLYFNSKWWIQNIWYTIRHPEDLSLAVRYALKIVKNFTFNKMSHAH